MLELRVSISSTFHEKLFHTKVILQLFSSHSLALSFFWQKNIGTKAVVKNIGEIDFKLSKNRMQDFFSKTTPKYA